jgi:hypothetical protein
MPPGTIDRYRPIADIGGFGPHRYHQVMKIEQLFEVVKAKWPAEVDISVAHVDLAGRFSCESLFALWEAIDEESGDAEGIVQSALWPFHQALSQVARVSFAAGAGVVAVETVGIHDFAGYLKFGLQHPSWAAELEVFLRDNPAA